MATIFGYVDRITLRLAKGMDWHERANLYFHVSPPKTTLADSAVLMSEDDYSEMLRCATLWSLLENDLTKVLEKHCLFKREMMEARAVIQSAHVNTDTAIAEANYYSSQNCAEILRELRSFKKLVLNNKALREARRAAKVEKEVKAAKAAKRKKKQEAMT
jgi:hypothetical protein